MNFFIVILTIQLISSHNIDVDHAIVYSSPSSSSANNRNDYFGYSVLLYENNERNISLLFVGAPRGNRTSNEYPDEPGIVYSCNNKNCTIVQPYNSLREDGFISSVRMKMTIEKEYAWFGAALAVEKSSGLLTICAPRTVIRIFNPLTYSNLETIHGMCYSGSISSTMRVYIEDKNLSEYNFKSSYWYNPLRGFSIHYPSLQPTGPKKEINRVIGEPKHDVYGTLDMVHMNVRSTINLPTSDELAQFGYSVTSGCYFGKNQLLYAGGAPGWRYVGMVVIVDHLKPTAVIKVEGQGIGGCFGASLTTGDINGDGLDDLIVGAPHYGQDTGLVYIFWGNSKKKFESSTNLLNTVKGAQFGYSLSCGDLDQDGFDDIIVGAPWEESGVVYVYNGNAGFQNQSKPSQKIIPSSSVKVFGFSLSQLVDMDQNGYPDIAVGAYGSSQAFIFHTRPVVEINLNVTTSPEKIVKGSRSFVIHVCIQLNRRKNISHKTDLEMMISVDERQKRTEETSIKFSVDGIGPNDYCLFRVVHFLENIENLIDPINVTVGYKLPSSRNGSKEFCKTCPTEKTNIQVGTTIAFDNGCGEDDVCISNVTVVIAHFIGITNNTWTIGSKDISLEIILYNSGEPAYALTSTVIIPKGISLRNVLPSCLENTTGNGVRINCDIANPLEREQEKSMILNLDMTSLIEESTLNFSIIVRTLSENEGSSNRIVPLRAINDVSLALDGKANQENYYILDDDRSDTNVTFEHIYQISNHGLTPIMEAQIVINVPRIFENDLDNLLIHVHDIQSRASGNSYECYENNNNKSTDESFTCDIKEISLQHSGIVLVQMIYDRSKLQDKSFDNRMVIKLITDIRVNVVRPLRYPKSASKTLTTKFHCISVKNQRISNWIIMISFCLGLVLFFVLIRVLNKYGFFKRIVNERIAKIENQKENENIKQGGSTNSYELLELQ